MSWLEDLRGQLRDLDYREATYWASFRDRSSGRAIAYLNPSKRSIRLFLQLPPTEHLQLFPAPSTKSWRDRFPSIFQIATADQLPFAFELILWSFVNAAPPGALVEPTVGPISAVKPSPLRVDSVPTDSELAFVRQRRGQDRIRRLTLLNYNSACALCDIADPRMLVASHIIPWAVASQHRGALANVICLCCFHDVLFERGFWSLTDDLSVLRLQTTSKTVEGLLAAPLMFKAPRDHAPEPTFLRHHRSRFGYDSPSEAAALETLDAAPPNRGFQRMPGGPAEARSRRCQR